MNVTHLNIYSYTVAENSSKFGLAKSMFEIKGQQYLQHKANFSQWVNIHILSTQL